MTVYDACKRIGYHARRSNKGLTGYRKSSIAEKLSIHAPRQLTPADSGTDFDRELKGYENSARYKCLKIYRKLSLDKYPAGLEQMLAQHILPALQRIGFETVISKMLFGIAPSAWNSMGRVGNAIIALQPLIYREIEAVRRGLESKLDHCSDRYCSSGANRSGFIPGSINDGQFPEQLFDTLAEIPTPWIILPRASRFLKNEHCRYLPLYIKILNTEDHKLCLNLFSRITIEFIANYAFRFADRCLPKDQVSKLLFYGYAALFWKTLRCPPENLEDSAIFGHFFTWLSRFARQNDRLGKAENAVLDQMIKMKTLVFPAIDTKSFRRSRQPDSSRFLVALRHGTAGTVATLRHFGIDQFFKTRRTGNRFTCLTFQKELLCLMVQIRTRYPAESKRTRANFRHFINQMRAVCDRMQPDFNRTQHQFVEGLLNQMQKFVNS